jgi:hypothetical protein
VGWSGGGGGGEGGEGVGAQAGDVAASYAECVLETYMWVRWVK